MRILPKLALVAGAGLAALLAAELYFRFGRDIEFMAPDRKVVRDRESWGELVHRPSDLPGLAYELTPGYEGATRGMEIRINDAGMRDRPPRPEDTPDLFRIAVIGDSYIFGYGVAQEDLFPILLEDSLNGSELGATHTFDTLNFGVSGYSTQDEVIVLRERALDWDPRVIVLAYCLNDPEVESIQHLRAHFVPPCWWQYSDLLRYVAQKRQAHGIARHGHGNYLKFLHAPEGPKWSNVTTGFRAIRDLAAARDIPVVLLVQPCMTYRSWDEYEYAEVHAQVAEAGRAEGFVVADLLPTYREHDMLSLRVAEDDSHPNALGHRLAAEVLAATVADVVKRNAP